jgi:integrase
MIRDSGLTCLQQAGLRCSKAPSIVHFSAGREFSQQKYSFVATVVRPVCHLFGYRHRERNASGLASGPEVGSGPEGGGMPLEITHEDFMTPEQVLALKEYCRKNAQDPALDGRKNPVRDWAILHVALDTGLRVSEICSLRIRDCMLDHGNASLIVRHGKGNRKRGVKIGSALRQHLLEFLAWKEKNGESTAGRAPLFVSARTGGPLTRSAVYRIFKAVAEEIGLPKRFSIHSCRHTYASLLYRASDYNIRLVQKQLGHRSIQTTQIYADVLNEDAMIAVDRLPQ